MKYALTLVIISLLALIASDFSISSTAPTSSATAAATPKAGSAASTAAPPNVVAAGPSAASPIAKIYSDAYTSTDYNAKYNAYTKEYYTVGMAIGQAEFHFLRPASDPRIQEGQFADDYLSSSWYDFWQVLVRYDLPYNAPATSNYRPDRAQVNMGPLFPLSMLSSATSVQVGASYHVEVALNAAYSGHLSDLVSSKAGYSHVDWFGLPPDANGDTTLLEAVLVVDDIAYLPFSVNDIVAGAQYGVPIIVASDISQDEADLLVERLGF